MIVLKKINTTHVAKTIQPGQTIEFFNLDLSHYMAYDLTVINTFLTNTQRGISKLTCIYSEGVVDYTAYAILGKVFATEISFSIAGDHCSVLITNNETSAVSCSIKLKTL